MADAPEWNASACADLVTAIVARAVRDAQSRNGHSSAARRWLAGDDCAELLALVGVDADYFRRQLDEVVDAGR